MKIDKENGFAFIDGRQLSICNVCENEKSMTYDLSNCVCEDCGSDNGFDKFKLNVKENECNI